MFCSGHGWVGHSPQRSLSAEMFLTGTVACEFLHRKTHPWDVPKMTRLQFACGPLHPTHATVLGHTYEGGQERETAEKLRLMYVLRGICWQSGTPDARLSRDVWRCRLGTAIAAKTEVPGRGTLVWSENAWMGGRCLVPGYVQAWVRRPSRATAAAGPASRGCGSLFWFVVAAVLLLAAAGGLLTGAGPARSWG